MVAARTKEPLIMDSPSRKNGCSRSAADRLRPASRRYGSRFPGRSKQTSVDFVVATGIGPSREQVRVELFQPECRDERPEAASRSNRRNGPSGAGERPSRLPRCGREPRNHLFSLFGALLWMTTGLIIGRRRPAAARGGGVGRGEPGTDAELPSPVHRSGESFDCGKRLCRGGPLASPVTDADRDEATSHPNGSATLGARLC